MTQVDIIGDNVVVEILGWHRVWALKRRIEIPLDHVESVASAAGASARPTGFRIPGSYVPGVVTAGSYYDKQGWSFWDTTSMDRSIVITTRNERFSRLILEVARPEETIELINAAIRGR